MIYKHIYGIYTHTYHTYIHFLCKSCALEVLESKLEHNRYNINIKFYIIYT